MSDFAIAMPAVRNARLKRRRKRPSGNPECGIVVTGGWLEVTVEGRKTLRGIRLWFSHAIPMHTVATCGAREGGPSLECTLISMTPWLAWRPWRYKFIADDYEAGWRFVEAAKAAREAERRSR